MNTHQMRLTINWPLQLACLALLPLLVLTSGCEQLVTLRKPEKTQTLLMAGSSSLKPVSDKLIAAFAKKNPGIIIVSEGGGSTAGVMALRRGVIDVAGMSRDVRRNEDARNIITLPLARNGIGFVVHAENPLNTLSPQALRDILTGRISDWGQLGDKSGGHIGDKPQPLKVQTRNKNSTTLRGVDDLLLQGDDMTKAAQLHETALELAKAVGSEPGALGFVSLADVQAMPPDVQKQVKFLAVNDVPMNRSTLLSGRYPLTRGFYYAFRDDASPVTRQFIDFCMSAEGQQILQAEGLLAVR